MNIGAFKSPYRRAGTGSSPLDWMPLDLMASEGSAGNDPGARTPTRFQADGPLLAAARQARGAYTRGRIVEGVIGSSDVWNEEIDRVAWFHTAVARNPPGTRRRFARKGTSNSDAICAADAVSISSTVVPKDRRLRRTLLQSAL